MRDKKRMSFYSLPAGYYFGIDDNGSIYLDGLGYSFIIVMFSVGLFKMLY
jgi:hypothetical protein